MRSRELMRRDAAALNVVVASTHSKAQDLFQGCAAGPLGKFALRSATALAVRSSLLCAGSV